MTATLSKQEDTRAGKAEKSSENKTRQEGESGAARKNMDESEGRRSLLFSLCASSVCHREENLKRNEAVEFWGSEEDESFALHANARQHQHSQKALCFSLFCSCLVKQ